MTTPDYIVPHSSCIMKIQNIKIFQQHVDKQLAYIIYVYMCIILSYFFVVFALNTLNWKV